MAIHTAGLVAPANPHGRPGLTNKRMIILLMDTTNVCKNKSSKHKSEILAVATVPAVCVINGCCKTCHCIELCHKKVDIETSSLHVQYTVYMVVQRIISMPEFVITLSAANQLKILKESAIIMKLATWLAVASVIILYYLLLYDMRATTVLFLHYQLSYKKSLHS